MDTPRAVPTKTTTWRPRWGGVGGPAAAVGLVVLAAAVCDASAGALSDGGVAMIFLLAVLASAAAFGLGPALLAALSSSLVYNYAFLEPRFTLRITHTSDLLTFAVFFAAALATGWATGRVRDQARALSRQAARTRVLLEASQALSAATTPDTTAQALTDQIAAATGAAAVVLTPEPGGALRLAAGPAGLKRMAEASEAAAQAAWTAGEAVTSDWTFLSLVGAQGRIGVVGLRSPAPNPQSDAGGLLAALMRQGAVALERAALAGAAAENEALRKSDALRSALLNSVSHDLRTPLSTVLGSATTLLDFEADLNPKVRRDLLESIREDAQRLNRYVGSLLDISRLEGGALRPRQIWTDVREVVQSAVAGLGERRGARQIRRDFPRELSAVKLDPLLLEQALSNVLENAVAYAPDGSTVEIAAYEDLANVLIAIEDQGPGIPADALESVFEKFRRLEHPTDRGRGLGLGLAIAKGFVEAMGGRIAATSPVADGRGTRILIALPKAARMPKDLL